MLPVSSRRLAAFAVLTVCAGCQAPSRLSAWNSTALQPPLAEPTGFARISDAADDEPILVTAASDKSPAGATWQLSMDRGWTPWRGSEKPPADQLAEPLESERRLVPQPERRFDIRRPFGGRVVNFFGEVRERTAETFNKRDKVEEAPGERPVPPLSQILAPKSTGHSSNAVPQPAVVPPPAPPADETGRAFISSPFPNVLPDLDGWDDEDDTQWNSEVDALNDYPPARPLQPVEPRELQVVPRQPDRQPERLPEIVPNLQSAPAGGSPLELWPQRRPSADPLPPLPQ